MSELRDRYLNRILGEQKRKHRALHLNVVLRGPQYATAYGSIPRVCASHGEVVSPRG
jgi:hypothetical protein